MVRLSWKYTIFIYASSYSSTANCTTSLLIFPFELTENHRNISIRFRAFAVPLAISIRGSSPTHCHPQCSGRSRADPRAGRRPAIGNWRPDGELYANEEELFNQWLFNAKNRVITLLGQLQIVAQMAIGLRCGIVVENGLTAGRYHFETIWIDGIRGFCWNGDII